MKLFMTAGVILSLAAFTAAQPAPVPEKGGAAANKKYKVANGDTLWGLSNKYYGDPHKWGKIYSANTGKISNPDRLYPKDELEIPEINETVRSSAPKAAETAEYVKADEPRITEKAAALPAEGTETAAPDANKEEVPAAAREKVKDADLILGNFSEEMPAEPTSWAEGTVMTVPGNWKEDGVIVSKIDSGGGAEESSLTVPGDRVRIKAALAASFQPGDVITAYLKVHTAYDKRTRKKLSQKLQKTGTLKVLSVNNNIVEARILRAITSVDGGQVIKK